MKFTYNNIEYKLILMTLAGSRFYGTYYDSEDPERIHPFNPSYKSDSDYRGVFIAHPDSKLGFSGKIEQIEIKKGKDGKVSEEQKAFIKELNEKLDCPITLKKIDQESIKEDLKDTYLLVNTTSVGMAPHPEGCIIESADMLPDGLKVADIIYNPKETKLLSYARQRGLDYMNGERMIVYQGACSFKFWTGKDMPIHEVKVALGMEESK